MDRPVDLQAFKRICMLILNEPRFRVTRRRRFTRAFKAEAVRLVSEQGLSTAEAARRSSVVETLLLRWMKLHGVDRSQ